MKFTEPIIGIEEFTALTAVLHEKIGKMMLEALDKGKVR